MDAFFDALRSGDRDAVARLLDESPTLLDAERGGTSAVMYALYGGRGELVEEFTKRGRKLGFHEACAAGDREIVEAGCSAEPHLASELSPDGFSPVALAIFFRHPALARLLIERGGAIDRPAENLQRVAPVHAAAAVSDHATMKILLERGADANARQQNDVTPLHGAASRGDIEMAKLLFEYGADPDVLTADGKTVADVAREHGKTAFLAYLSSLTSDLP